MNLNIIPSSTHLFRKAGILVYVAAVALITSCANKYNITGSSLLDLNDGTVVFLRYNDSGIDKTLDSCKLVHGNFKMSGNVDSTMVAMLDMEHFQVPVVLEEGEIAISSNNQTIMITGTELNDRMYAFLSSRDSLLMLLAELPNRESQMVFDGYDHDDILRQLGEEEVVIRRDIDKLETSFITANFDNVLGVSWFVRLCESAYEAHGYATTTPQIDEIYGLAPESFRNHPEVQKCMRRVEMP